MAVSYEYYEDFYDTNFSSMYYSNGDYYEIQFYTKTGFPTQVVLMGYVFPIFAVLTVLANILVIGVFASKSMRSPTSILLVALAIADSAVCFSVLPSSIYFYTLGHYETYVPFRWCYVDYYMAYSLQRIFRTTSNWITVALGVQRFVIVCRPLKAKRICTRNASFIVSITAFVFAVIFELQPLISIIIKPISVPSTNLTGSAYVGCTTGLREWYSQAFKDVQYTTTLYFLVNGIFTRLLPCCLLLVVTLYLIYKLNTRGKIIGHKASNTAVYEERVRRITSMVLAVAIVFLIAEIQDAIAFGIYIYDIVAPADSLGQTLSERADVIWDTVGFFLSVISYHCNFWIYVIMSRQFRMALKDTLIRIKSCRSDEQERTSSSYLPYIH